MVAHVLWTPLKTLTGVYRGIHFFGSKHRLWVLVRTALLSVEAVLTSTHNLFRAKKKILKIVNWHRRVNVSLSSRF